MNQRLSCVRDIFFLLILSLLIIFLVSLNKKKNHFFAFSGAYYPSVLPEDNLDDNPLEKQRSSRSVKPKKKKKYYKREFIWKDPTREERKTVFQIPVSAFKDEIKKFGRPPSMTHPLLVEKRGFKVIGRKNYIRNRHILERIFTMVDYRQIFQRNIKYFWELTGTLIASVKLPPEKDPLHVFLSFVQHIKYKRPPMVYRGKLIGSFFVPLVLLYKRYGDCDSKSVLLAEFLATIPDSKEKMGMVLIQGNGLYHALLGVKRKPFPGMTALYFRKKGYYIVLETTVQGWAPGFIDRRVIEALKSGYFQFLELN